MLQTSTNTAVRLLSEPLYLAVLALAFVTSCAVALAAWRRRRETPEATLLAATAAAAAVWAGGTAGLTLAADPVAELRWLQLSYVGIVASPIAFVLLAITYTGSDRLDPHSAARALVVVGGVFLALVWTNPLHHWYWRSIEYDPGVIEGISTSPAPGFWAFVVFTYGLLSVGSVLFVRYALTAPELYRRQTASILLAVAAPWAANIPHSLQLMTADYTPIALSVTSVVLWVAIVRYRVSTVGPVALRTVFESISVGVFVLDHEDRVLEANAAGLALFGVDDAVIGEPFREVVPDPALYEQVSEFEHASQVDDGTTPADDTVSSTSEDDTVSSTPEDDASSSADAYTRPTDGGMASSTGTSDTTTDAGDEPALRSVTRRVVAVDPPDALGADGSGRRYYELRTTPIATRRGRRGERVVLVTDVTDRHRRRRRIEAQNERLDQFASVVSHDLRNPLNVAQGRLALAREEAESDHHAPIDRALTRMARLIDDLLVLAREGSADADLDPVEVPAVSRLGWDTVETADATLSIDGAWDDPILADRSRLQQLFENLFRNAVEHGASDDAPTADDDELATSDDETDAGDDGSGAESGVRVIVGKLEDGFYVEDDGPGIPADDREVVFEPGYSTGGTGLGLRIVKDVVEAHGWSIRVTDGADGGARFEITDVQSAGDVGSTTDAEPAS